MTERFALYFAPAQGTPLDDFGSRWLGRSAWTSATLDQPAVVGFSSDETRQITASPRRYGFHATLKPPFALAPGKTEAALVDAVAAFATKRPAFRAPPLCLRAIGSFLALVPAERSADIHELADACVAEFDGFRAPPSADEVAKRKQAKLSPGQEAHLARWGYPYVFDEFRFHMTLTNSLEPGLRERALKALEPLAEPLCRDGLLVDGLALFHEPEAGADFRILRYFALGEDR